MSYRIRSGQLGFPILELDTDPFASMESYPGLLWQIYSDLNIDRFLPDLVCRFEGRLDDLEGKLISTGSGAERFSSVTFYRWLIFRQNAVGQTQAYDEADSYLASERVPVEVLQYLIGPEIDEKIVLDNDVTIGPIPMAGPSREIEQFYQAKAFSSLSVARPTSVARILTTSRKVYDEDNPEFDWVASQRLQWICWSMNALDDVFCFPGLQTSRLTEGVPPGPFAGSGSSRAIYDFLPDRTCRIDSNEDRERLIEVVCSKWPGNTKSLDRMHIALQRLGQAKAKSSPAERALDLGIAVEMLLNGEQKTELAYRMRSRGAWLLGRDAESRKQVFRSLGDIYDARSSVAHTGSISPKQDLRIEHANLIAQIARSIIQRGKFLTDAEWNAITLGEQA